MDAYHPTTVTFFSSAHIFGRLTENFDGIWDLGYMWNMSYTDILKLQWAVQKRQSIEMLFGLWIWVGPRNGVTWGAHVTNMTEPSVFGDDAALLSYYSNHLFLFEVVSIHSKSLHTLVMLCLCSTRSKLHKWLTNTTCLTMRYEIMLIVCV